MEENLEIDNIFDEVPKKKRRNSKGKGNRNELILAKLLTARFGKSFSRSVGSGNRWGQVSNLPAHAKEVYFGDLCCPENFKWVIECKAGYEDKIDLNGVFEDGCATLDSFIEQSSRDSEATGRLPIILWKRSFKPWLAMVRRECLDGEFECNLSYKNWNVVLLGELLKRPDNYWFRE